MLPFSRETVRVSHRMKTRHAVAVRPREYGLMLRAYEMVGTGHRTGGSEVRNHRTGNRTGRSATGVLSNALRHEITQRPGAASEPAASIASSRAAGIPVVSPLSPVTGMPILGASGSVRRISATPLLQPCISKAKNSGMTA